MFAQGFLRFTKWLVTSTDSLALLLRLPPVALFQWYFGGYVWMIGVFFIIGIPLRNLENLFLNLAASKRVPGPFLAKATRLWKFAKISGGSFQKTLVAAHQTYGHIVQIGPYEYSFDDPNAIDQIYRGPGGGFQKADWYACSTPPPAEAHSLFSVRDRDRHREIRRVLGPYYRRDSIQRYGPLLEPCLEDLRRSLDEAAASKGLVELPLLLNLFAFDAIGRITTGNNFGALRGDEVPMQFLDALKVALRYFATMGDFSEWHPLLFSMTQHLGYINGLPLVNKFIGRQIKYRLQHKASESEDMISDFMPYAYSESDPGRTDRSLRHLCETNILPGADTTATAICAVIFFLSQHPDSVETLRSELRDHRKSGDRKLSNYGSLWSLRYLQAVVKEAMRLHPPIGLMNPRVVPEGGATICGHYFVGGSVVGTNAFAMHHNPEIWDSDHDAFRPERWLVNEEEGRRLDHAFFAWGTGSRECIGKHIALLEIYRVLEMLVLRYDFDVRMESVKWSNFQFTQFSQLTSRVSLRVT